MLKDAIVIREIVSKDSSIKSYEVYDSDTGSSLGNYDSLDRAETERRHMQSSDAAAKKGEADMDPRQDNDPSSS
ncbi:hypothetical protein [Modicisalibacter luteus]|uniref:Uncharacterized protein n=1 Tax=Modicisalibacter luteus TaxID=453962 RepID=A0ABV7M7J3_9GAMM|nr:hypothetical protein [Halomonas lutea]GHB15571.1 hypothetical protein GCM10007159_42340 [Halomonas lutea]